MTLAGACATLAGLVFIAMSLHPQATLAHPLMRMRALVAASGFVLMLTWSLILLMPVRTAPLTCLLLLVVGIGGAISLLYQEVKVRKLGLNRARVVVGDAVLLAPVVAGVTGLLLPASPLPFMVVAVGTSVALFVLFSQSWTLVLHTILDSDGPQRSMAHSDLSLTPPRERSDTDPQWTSAVPAQTGPSTEVAVGRRVDAADIRPLSASGRHDKRRGPRTDENGTRQEAVPLYHQLIDRPVSD
jgi:hypothetical protein